MNHIWTLSKSDITISHGSLLQQRNKNKKVIATFSELCKYFHNSYCKKKDIIVRYKVHIPVPFYFFNGRNKVNISHFISRNFDFFFSPEIKKSVGYCEIKRRNYYFFFFLFRGGLRFHDIMTTHEESWRCPTWTVQPNTPIMSIAMPRYSDRTSHQGFRTLNCGFCSDVMFRNSFTGIIFTPGTGEKGIQS